MVTGIREQAWLAIDEFVESFELAWSSGQPPDVAGYLPDVMHPQFLAIHVELLRVDLELRWQNGYIKSLDDYRAEFPDLLSDLDALGQLAFEEFRARRQAGEIVSSLEYAQRFGVDSETWPRVASYPQTEPVSVTKGHEDRYSQLDPLSENGFPTVGTDLHAFHLQCELGRGAFSRVYLARQGDLANRLVVLKVSAESFAEADKLAQLQHANIVPIYSVHQVGRNSAVCMPYFGTTTLADVARELHGKQVLPPSGQAIVDTLAAASRLTENVLPADASAAGLNLGESKSDDLTEGVASPSDDDQPRGLPAKHAYDGYLKTLSGLTYVESVLWIGAKLADGLQHAHERGILHLDLKPANVLMADDGRPMLLDFNLSTDLKSSDDQREKMVGGTLPYMAPEQIVAFQLRHACNDPRSDVFSLGVILFELLGGQSPFPAVKGSSDAQLSVMLRDRRELRPRLASLNVAVTPAVEAIVLRCLAPEPSLRYQSAAELHEDLERQLNHLPLRYCPEPSWRERSQKWTRRHARLTSILSVALLVTGVASAVAAFQEHERFEAVQAEIATHMKAGQEALDADDPELAQGRYLQAWMLVQAEPALAEQQSSVAGWLDHARRATLQRQLKWHVPPREFDVRRDEAMLLAMLLPQLHADSLPVAQRALEETLEFTVPRDPGWTVERERLTLLQADLLAIESGPDEALRFLDQTHEFASRAVHLQRARLLEQLKRVADAAAAREQALKFPQKLAEERLLDGVRRARDRDFDAAVRDFEDVLNVEPQMFVARFLQAVCLQQQQQRWPEAKVAFAGCLAQRPQFLWSEYFLCVARSEMGDKSAVESSLQRVLSLQPSKPLEESVRNFLR